MLALDRPLGVVADLALFGGHGHLLFARWLPQASQVMHLFYLSYYGLVLGPPLDE